MLDCGFSHTHGTIWNPKKRRHGLKEELEACGVFSFTEEQREAFENRNSEIRIRGLPR